MSLTYDPSGTAVACNVLSAANLKDLIVEHMVRALGRDPSSARPRDIYEALAITVREELAARWVATQKRVAKAKTKRVCYLSVEFLPGRALLNALSSLEGDMVSVAREAVAELGYELDEVIAEEHDPGLGNGGLGRLAACFLDSLATLQYAAVGYGIRYDYGIFTQVIEPDGAQREIGSSWLRLRDPWELTRPQTRYLIQFGGHCVTDADSAGEIRYSWVDTQKMYAVGFDHLVPGNRCATVNHLRLWTGRAIVPFNVSAFNHGHYPEAVADQVRAKNLSRVLYPDDSTVQGKELRLSQQYFFVSASLQDLLATLIEEGRSLEDLPDAVAIQLNDTHPALAVAELMRLLIDLHGFSWEKAWSVVSRTFGYTNHTLLPEALESWPVDFFERLLPRHLVLIFQINRHFLDEISLAFPGDLDRRRRMSLIDEEHGRSVRMAHLAVVASHKVNGVAKLHSDLMRETIFHDFSQLWPARFTNVTNGITVRRWLKQSNPGLSALFTEKLGSVWENDLSALSALEGAEDDHEFCGRFAAIKLENKRRLAAIIQQHCGISVDENSLFDVQVKRIHEYKRQLLNLLGVIARYNRIHRDPTADYVPRTVIFAGKAAPGYYLAKAIIRLANNVARVVNSDPVVAGRLKVVFLADYDVSLAQRIMPAADLSEQISTAGLEASGTGNMKLALNGALTIGTLDGANIEIKDHVGDEHIFIFGMTAAEVTAEKSKGYRPSDYVDSDAELAQTIAMIDEGYFSNGDVTEAKAIVGRLLSDGEPFLVCADFRAYMDAQDQVDVLYRNRNRWLRSAVVNSIRMGFFSSDRSIREYASRIWNIQPVT